MPRKKYSEDQISRALLKMDSALEEWGWSNQNDVIKLFLVRQMIARRMGFSELNKLFNGPFLHLDLKMRLKLVSTLH